MENRSPQWAKNAANKAKRRAEARTKSLGSMSGNYSVDEDGRVRAKTVTNKEGREYKVFHGRNWWKDPEQISGPPMPSAWLPESGYGASPRPGPLPALPEPPVYGVYGVPHENGSVAYGGKPSRRSRKTRSRKTRRRHR